MMLYQLIAATIDPYDVIMVFDEDSHTLYNLFDFVNESLKNGVTYLKLFNSFVTNICVNGDALQCEVMINE